MTVDPMAVYRAIADAAEPQIKSSAEGKYLTAVLGDAGMAQLRTLIDKIARNSANGIAFEIEEACERAAS